ncbi:MAG: PAS domain-containing sensor histidine kinase [Candidatus Cyclonatronum sp.]|uniref:sensor histidine kinase n=1 Tax=Cyclonatronum sp. TaxID=3024185 RepID=UPI0025C24297|nr:PAS domain-containing sensor histidine kinase [Cyclonatronum sp.]MCH8485806.1 PAS domain-containing sensor histidine kinase [Cyclonatronum sp.]
MFVVKELEESELGVKGNYSGLNALWCIDENARILFRNGIAAGIEHELPGGPDYISEVFRNTADAAAPGCDSGAPALVAGFEIRPTEQPGIFVAQLDVKEKPPAKPEFVNDELLRILTEIDVGIFVTGQDGDIIFVNKAFARFFGYEGFTELSEEVASITQLYKKPNERGTLLKLIKDKGQVDSVDGLFKHRDGSTIRLTGIVKRELRESDGRIFLHGAVLASAPQAATDRIITPYISLFESLPDGVAVADLSGKIVYVNRSFSKMFGPDIKPSGIKLSDSLLAYNQSSENQLKAFSDDIFRITREKGSHSGRYYHITKTVRRVVVAVSCSQVKSIIGISSGFVMLARDITKKAEEQRHLMLAKQRADDANKLKESVLSNLSHETRTPLTSIIGFSSILCEYLGEADQEISDFAQNIMRSAEQLLKVINNMLLLAEQELNKSKYPLSKVNVSTLMHEVLPEIEQDTMNSGLEFRHNIMDDLYAETNHTAVVQILQMLGANAVKFTEKGYVAVRAGRVNGAFIYIEIEDTGVGIASGMLEQIFDPFIQESFGTTRHFPGAGLGLSVCKKLSAIINADILVQSKKGIGSVFRLLIPVKAQ